MAMEVDDEAFEFDGVHLNVSTGARAGVWRGTCLASLFIARTNTSPLLHARVAPKPIPRAVAGMRGREPAGSKEPPLAQQVR